MIFIAISCSLMQSLILYVTMSSRLVQTRLSPEEQVDMPEIMFRAIRPVGYVAGLGIRGWNGCDDWVGPGIDRQSRSFDVMEISRPDGLGGAANLGTPVPQATSSTRSPVRRAAKRPLTTRSTVDSAKAVKMISPWPQRSLVRDRGDAVPDGGDQPGRRLTLHVQYKPIEAVKVRQLANGSAAAPFPFRRAGAWPLSRRASIVPLLRMRRAR
jgi:hypothetical protein